MKLQTSPCIMQKGPRGRMKKRDRVLSIQTRCSSSALGMKHLGRRGRCGRRPWPPARHCTASLSASSLGGIGSAALQPEEAEAIRRRPELPRRSKNRCSATKTAADQLDHDTQATQLCFVRTVHDACMIIKCIERCRVPGL
jgi:hypothetical protein